MNSTTAFPVIPPTETTRSRPKVSVVTACFNALDGLTETIESVAAQNLADVEHVIVDGGSNDGTVEYLDSLGTGVSWISEPDDGIGDAMNKGLLLARGEWIIVLHAGDVFVDTQSLELVNPSFTDKAHIVTCGILFGSGSNFRKLHFPNPRRRLLFKAILHQGTICRREVFESIGGFDQSYSIAMDYEFFLRARASGYRFATCDLVLARMDDAGVSSLRDWPSLKTRFAEERRAQLAHCQSVAMRLVYAVYWPLYLCYRKARSVFAGRLK